MTRIAGLVLAGGRGRRLGGVVKADLLVGGRRLADRVAETLLRDADPVLLAIGGLSPARIRAGAGLERIPDPLPDRGPAGGLMAVAAWAARLPVPPDFVAVAAVDLPFLPADFVARALAAIGDAGAAFAQTGDDDGERDHPVAALWRLDALRRAAASVPPPPAPSPGLKALLAGAGGVAVPFAGAGDAFAGVNTLAELLAANRRAAAPM